MKSLLLSIFVLTVFVTKSCKACGFLTDLHTTRFQVEETAKPGVPLPFYIGITDDVTGINFATGNRNNNKYFDFSIDPSTSPRKILFYPKPTLGTFFEKANSSVVLVHKPTLMCGSTTSVSSSYPIHITILDVNNRPPQFDPPPSFRIQLPYRGAPINWAEPLKVRDGDYLDFNTRLQFSVDPRGPIHISTNPPPIRVQSFGRLRYYQVYISLNESWETPGNYTVTMSATDGLHVSEQPLQLTILPPPAGDKGTPTLLENPNYHNTLLSNSLGEQISVATVADDFTPIQFLITELDGQFKDRFETLTDSDGNVFLELKQVFTAEELENYHGVIRLTLGVTDEALNTVGLPLAVQFEPIPCGDKKPVVTEDPIYHEYLLSNTIGETLSVAKVSDDFTPLTSLSTSLDGNYSDRFLTFLDSEGNVILQQIKTFSPQELKAQEYLLRFTLTITDTTGQQTKLPLAIPFGRIMIQIHEDFIPIRLTKQTSSAVGKVSVVPDDNVEFKLSPENAGLKINGAGEILTTMTDEGIKTNAGWTDVFFVTATRHGVANARVPIIATYEPEDNLTVSTTAASHPSHFTTTTTASSPTSSFIPEQQIYTSPDQSNSDLEEVFITSVEEQAIERSGGYRQSECESEGYFPHPTSCTKFRRCTFNGNTGTFKEYIFDCPPGSVLWCQATLTCSFAFQCPETCRENYDTDPY